MAIVEHILRYSAERYRDTVTGRLVVVGRHGEHLVMIPYERGADGLTPVTIHTVTRRQVNARLTSGRFEHE